MKYCATVAYSGEAYSGFQRQKSKRTIQGEIEKQLSFLLGEETRIKGAGRTDAGVHALGQTFSFVAKDIEDLSAFLKALNRLLPVDIYVKSIRPVADTFDARHSCIGKVYSYQFTVNEPIPSKVGKIAQLRRDDFDFDLFLRGLREFEGRHNFQNFTTKPEDKDGFVRDVHIVEAKAEEEGNFVTVVLKADGFMRYQIRFMIGSCIRVATGKMKPEDIANALNDGPRNIIPYKAPPEGLYLVEVLYGN